jgi:type VI secretion system protein ImpM
MNGAVETAPGFHGKLMSKGDFVTRRVPRGFLDAWDSWLQEVVGGSRERMGEAWLEAYLNCPLWRFVLTAGLCGDAAAAGVMMPSVDRVGRYFPLTIVAVLPQGTDPALVPAGSGDWFRRAEGVVQTTLDEPFDFDRFDAEVAALGLPVPGSSVAAPSLPIGVQGIRMSLVSADAVDEAIRDLAGRLLRAVYPHYSLWWTSGSADSGASFIACDGLPSAESFAAFLDGRWEQWGWSGAAPSLPMPVAAHT